MNQASKILFLFLAFALVSSPSGYSLMRKNEPGGDGGVHPVSNPPAANPAPSLIPADSNGQCPANYRCSQCAHR